MWGVDVTLTQDVGCSLSANGGGADVAVGGDLTRRVEVGQGEGQGQAGGQRHDETGRHRSLLVSGPEVLLGLSAFSARPLCPPSLPARLGHSWDCPPCLSCRLGHSWDCPPSLPALLRHSWDCPPCLPSRLGHSWDCQPCLSARRSFTSSAHRGRELSSQQAGTCFSSLVVLGASACGLLLKVIQGVKCSGTCFGERVVLTKGCVCWLFTR